MYWLDKLETEQETQVQIPHDFWKKFCKIFWTRLKEFEKTHKNSDYLLTETVLQQC